MKHVAVVVLLLAVVGVAACGDDGAGHDATRDPAAVYSTTLGGIHVEVHIREDGHYTYRMAAPATGFEWQEDGTWRRGRGVPLMTPVMPGGVRPSIVDGAVIWEGKWLMDGGVTLVEHVEPWTLPVVDRGVEMWRGSYLLDSDPHLSSTDTEWVTLPRRP